MSSEKKQIPKRKRRWFQLRLRTMLVLVTLVCIALGTYKPLLLHRNAVRLINRKAGSIAIIPHPNELHYYGGGSDDGAIFQVGLIKIALLGSFPSEAGSAGFIPITEDSTYPEQSGNTSVNGYNYFSYSYAEGQAECLFYEFPFLCTKRTIQINDQSFDIATPTVVLVDSNHKILYSYSR